MDLGLDGRVAVVTGASRGIGLATTRCLVEAGVRVVAGAHRSSDELDALAETGSVEVVLGDLAQPEAPARLVAAAGPRLDILVNNVGGVSTRAGGFLEITDAQWEATLQLDLMAAVRAIRAALPPMLAAGRGVIATVGSVNAFLPDPLVLDYGAAKAALVNALKALSKEVGPRGVRVVTVNPGPVATDLWLGGSGVAAQLSATSGRSPQQVAESAVAGSATGRFTTPEEVAQLLVLLASDRAGNVTGAGLTVDGGLSPGL
ncbi:SDR family NAD(P)-dependent oxidoreductase [Petropleomorpha daqingensis]|uniref:NAD(P)-dependent dehydrogenase (Short-subunit alcohol dehydrogenase family) n=1 Tax=Petropleomorpha daqingensis TaxID=2026353 RepID=A0A853CGN7_9ACTN|nr:SDR family oxidoreductase [Petropleomorpha daqingensis]NYJ06396.1 NAD(P)-dependent dehydrogenase (short-subunit alcohol dehydrogenase family) [Petropleomorpha daqingensis]